MTRAKLGDSVEDACSPHYDKNYEKHRNCGVACCYLCACPIRNDRVAWVAVGPGEKREVFADAATAIDNVKVGSSCLRRVPRESILPERGT